ncbi:unnamed protein product [Rhizopus stolonifer]
MGNCVTTLQVAKTKPQPRKSSTNQQTKTIIRMENAIDTLDPTGVLNYTTINSFREFHNEKASTYWLPKDEDEQKRLTGQHFAIKEMLEGNVLKKVRDGMNFDEGISVLDVGCGSGVWIMDMIDEYPRCTYHGCDIVDTTNKILSIDQFTFNQGNVVKGLPYPDNTFDFVCMRLLVAALREGEWPIAIKELIRVTKPGGMIQSTEIDITLPKDKSSPHYKFVNALSSLSISKGQNPRIALELERLFSENDNITIIQSEYRHCNMNSNTSTAKKLIWDTIEMSKSTLNHIGPIIGLNGKEDALNFMRDLKQSLPHTDYNVCVKSIALQKS